MSSVNIIGKSNGAGLSRDLNLLKTALSACGCQVHVTVARSRDSRRRRSWLANWGDRAWSAIRSSFARKAPAPRYDYNIMLEHVWPQFRFDARINIVVPNPEFFDHHDVSWLRCVDRIWAKTQNTRKIFSQFDRPITTIGFDSDDRYDATVQRSLSFFHLAGNSTLKGTQRLINKWSRHPQWPKLVVVIHARDRSVTAATASNIEYHTEYLSDDALRQLQNASWFHLCTSETEGWGHYIAEAMSVGAVTVTLDAPPMNELVTPERGILIPFAATGQQKLATRYFFDEAALENIIDRLKQLGVDDVAQQSAAARAWFQTNKQGFVGRLTSALNQHDQSV